MRRAENQSKTRVVAQYFCATAGIGATFVGCHKTNSPDLPAVTSEQAKVGEVSAGEAIVDENYRFRLESPGQGWTLLQGRDAQGLHPAAVVGAVHHDSVLGFVTVEHMPETTLDEASNLLSATLPGTASIESERTLTYNAEAAIRHIYTVPVSGEEFRCMRTAFLHQDHLYQVLSCGSASASPELVTAFQSALAIVDGKVTGRRADRPVVAHADGVGWRIRKGRFESALSGLSLDPPDGWTFIVGPKLRLSAPDAEVALIHSEHDATVAIVSEAMPQATAETQRVMLEDGLVQRWGPPADEPVRLAFAGGTIELKQYDANVSQLLHGIRASRGVLSQATASYPKFRAERARSDIAELLAAFEVIPRPNQESLWNELIDTVRRQRHFATRRSFRAGQFFDFENEIVWTMPEGHWEIRDFDQALRHSPDTVLYFEEVRLGVHGALEVLEGESFGASAVFETLLADKRVSERRTEDVDERVVHRATAVGTRQDAPFPFVIAVTSHKGSTVALTMWSAADSRAHRHAMQTAEQGLQFPKGLQPVEFRGDMYVDHHYGIRFSPPEGMPYKDLTLPGFGRGRVSSWRVGKRHLVLMALHGPGAADEDWLVDYFERGIESSVGVNLDLHDAERSPGTLGGRPCQRLRWKNDDEVLEADVIVAENFLYSISFNNLDPATIAEVRRSFEILE